MLKTYNIYYIYYEELSVIGFEGRQELPPLGTLFFAAALHEVGIQVRVIPFTDEYCLFDFDKNTDFIGYSITSSIVYPHYKKLSEKIKIYCPHAITLAGNTHANLFPKEVLTNLEVDGVLCGESEYSILVLLHNYLLKPHKFLFYKVPGSYASQQYHSDIQHSIRVNNISLIYHTLTVKHLLMSILS